jgi:hypothetical protein
LGYVLLLKEHTVASPIWFCSGTVCSLLHAALSNVDCFSNQVLKRLIFRNLSPILNCMLVSMSVEDAATAAHPAVSGAEMVVDESQVKGHKDPKSITKIQLKDGC